VTGLFAGRQPVFVTKPGSLKISEMIEIAEGALKDGYLAAGGSQRYVAASSGSPFPLQRASCGYGQTGRVLIMPLVGSSSVRYFVAIISRGATPCSTHRWSARDTLWAESWLGRKRSPMSAGSGPVPYLP
jgi:hypothetical protein